ncbi:SRPBCC family protein [Nocardia sp. NPDC088792]|uniref:SRPBCC family protein n=1 Tax=Nocardia sp. NPDC088792 TaxID=3364332 RepID=UPI003808ED3C
MTVKLLLKWGVIGMGSLEPQDMSYFDVAPVKSTASIECPVPARVVFAVLADHRRWPEWIGMGVSAAEPTSQPESGVGSTRTLVIARGALRVREWFIAWEEPAVWAFTGIDCRPRVFAKLVEGFGLESLGEGSCRITYRMGCELPLLLKPMSPFFGRIWTRAIVGALPNLVSAAVRRQQSGSA